MHRASSCLCYPVLPFPLVCLSFNLLKQSVQQYSCFFQCCLPGATCLFTTVSGNGIPWTWQWRTASNMMQTAKHLLCHDPSRMPIINLDLGNKLLAFCFLKCCHRTAFLNRAHETACRLCLLHVEEGKHLCAKKLVISLRAV